MQSKKCAVTATKGSNLPANQKMIEGVEAATMNDEIERRHRPHQGVFEAERIPEIAADTPALDIGHRQEDEDRHRHQTCEQAESEKRTAQELGDRDRRRPEPARTIAALIELPGQRFQAVHLET